MILYIFLDVNKNMCFKKLNNVIETISNKMTYLENSFKARMDSMEQQINRLSSKSKKYIHLISVWYNVTSIVNNQK